ncbi:MAG: penicillin-binding protein 2, partial [Henriciella sp.]
MMAVEVPWLSVDGSDDGSMNTRLVSMLLLSVFAVLAMSGAQLALQPAATGGAVLSAPIIADRRADIVDRNGRLLATSVTLYSLKANPQLMMNGELVADELVAMFPDLNRERLVRR